MSNDEKLVHECPPQKEFYFAILNSLSDGKEKRLQQLYVDVAKFLKLSEMGKRDSAQGGSIKYKTRTRYGKDNLRLAGYIDPVGDGLMKITPKGEDLIKNNPDGLSLQVTNGIYRFGRGASQSISANTPADNGGEENLDIDKPPEEIFDDAKRIMESDLASDILERLKNNSAAFFEEAIKDVLEAMGYGEGKVLGSSGDGGIDGIVNQDKLGLNRIYYQAKRHKANVGPGSIRDFSGAIGENKATSGLFVTTADFTPAAITAAERADKLIVIINGDELARLMIKYNVGCETEATIAIKKLDDDYFRE